jgi:hypothetical protein
MRVRPPLGRHGERYQLLLTYDELTVTHVDLAGQHPIGRVSAERTRLMTCDRSRADPYLSG